MQRSKIAKNTKPVSGQEEQVTWAQFHGSAYRKHRRGAYGIREFCAYGKRISRVSGEFGLLRVRTPRY